MPDAKQRAQDALEHLEAFVTGPLADVRAELRKVAGEDSGKPGAKKPAAAPEAAEKDETPAPARAAKQDTGA
jgi:hypothetical protein